MRVNGISVSNRGVQITVQNADYAFVRKSWFPGDGLWSFMEELASKYLNYPIVRDKKLTRVDVGGLESQFTFQ